MDKMPGLLDPRTLILLFVGMLITFSILPLIFSEIVDFASLAILGSFGGGTAIVLVIGTVILAGLVLAVVDHIMGGRIMGAVTRRARRRRPPQPPIFRDRFGGPGSGGF